MIGKINFQGNKHKVNSESTGAIFPVVSTDMWNSRKLELTTPVIPSSSVFLTSAVIPTFLLLLRSYTSFHLCDTLPVLLIIIICYYFNTHAG